MKKCYTPTRFLTLGLVACMACRSSSPAQTSVSRILDSDARPAVASVDVLTETTARIAQRDATSENHQDQGPTVTMGPFILVHPPRMGRSAQLVPSMPCGTGAIDTEALIAVMTPTWEQVQSENRHPTLRVEFTFDQGVVTATHVALNCFRSDGTAIACSGYRTELLPFQLKTAFYGRSYGSGFCHLLITGQP